jgi:hypothetical protein
MYSISVTDEESELIRRCFQKDMKKVRKQLQDKFSWQTKDSKIVIRYNSRIEAIGIFLNKEGNTISTCKCYLGEYEREVIEKYHLFMRIAIDVYRSIGIIFPSNE